MQRLSDRKLTDKLHIVVSAGGTLAPIDQVRGITNSARGLTGTIFAETALADGHTISFVGSRCGHQPFKRKLQVDPEINIEQEISRIKQVISDYMLAKPNLNTSIITTFEQYQLRLLSICKDHKPDVAVLSMAANDYGTDVYHGKISSTEEFLNLKLKRLPKIISELRQQQPRIFLVGFKHEVGIPPDQLIESAYKNVIRDRQDIVVANVQDPDLAWDPRKMPTFLLTKERGIIPVEREQLATKLLSLIKERHSRSHFSTRLRIIPENEFISDEIEQFKNNVQKLSRFCLFPQYQADDKREFGFVAARSSDSFLITSRGSTKSQATVNDVTRVRQVDFNSRKISVESLRAKASLNAPLASLIFRMRKDVNFIIHSHIELPNIPYATVHSTPGTLEDCEAVETLIAAGHKIIGQPAHGILMLVSDLKEVPELLAQHCIYNQRPELYDLAYHRFTRRFELLNYCEKFLPSNAKILDLAAGSGEVSSQLWDRGFKDLTLADRSASMLSVASKKLEGKVAVNRFIVCSMEELNLQEKYQGIVIRQAINYIAPQDLTKAFSNIRKHLDKNGTLLFNSFNLGTKPPVLTKARREIHDGYIISTVEGNNLEGKSIIHSQRTEIFHSKRAEYHQVYDLNTFYAHSIEDYKDALKAADFKSVEVYLQGVSIYVIAKD